MVTVLRLRLRRKTGVGLAGGVNALEEGPGGVVWRFHHER